MHPRWCFHSIVVLPSDCAAATPTIGSIVRADGSSRGQHQQVFFFGELFFVSCGWDRHFIDKSLGRPKRRGQTATDRNGAEEEGGFGGVYP